MRKKYKKNGGGGWVGWGSPLPDPMTYPKIFQSEKIFQVGKLYKSITHHPSSIIQFLQYYSPHLLTHTHTHTQPHTQCHILCIITIHIKSFNSTMSTFFTLQRYVRDVRHTLLHDSVYILVYILVHYKWIIQHFYHVYILCTFHWIDGLRVDVW